MEVKCDIMRGGWCSKEVGGPYGVGMWKCIRKGWDNFKQHVRFKVGNGPKYYFGRMCGVGSYH